MYSVLLIVQYCTHYSVLLIGLLCTQHSDCIFMNVVYSYTNTNQPNEWSAYISKFQRIGFGIYYLWQGSSFKRLHNSQQMIFPDQSSILYTFCSIRTFSEGLSSDWMLIIKKDDSYWTRNVGGILMLVTVFKKYSYTHRFSFRRTLSTNGRQEQCTFQASVPDNIS